MGGENSKEKAKSSAKDEKSPKTKTVAREGVELGEESELGDAGTESEETPGDTASTPPSTRTEAVRSKQSLIQELEQQKRQQIQNCLQYLPIPSNLKQSQKVIQFLSAKSKIIKFKSSTDVILKNKAGKGIFIVVEGIVEVVSEFGDVTIATLSKGEFFGEVSALFDVPSTARIKAHSDIELLLVKKDSLLKVTKGEVTMEIMDWFVTQKYLPTSELFDRKQMTRRLTLQTFSTASTFEGWHEQALKTLILSIEPTLIVLYPANATIIQRGDPPELMYLVIRGRVAIMDGTVALGRMSADDQAIVFNEEGVRYGFVSNITLRTETCCEVITIRRKWIKETMANSIPERASIPWDTRQNLWKKRETIIKTDLFDIFATELQLEVISERLKRTTLLNGFPMNVLYRLALQLDISYFKAEEKVYSEADMASEKVMIILHGRVKMVLPDKDAEILQSADGDQAFYDPVTMRSGCALIADMECLLLKLERAQIFAITDEVQQVDLDKT